MEQYNWDNVTDDELVEHLKTKKREYRKFVEQQQFNVNAKARYIAAMESELFRRKVAAQAPAASEPVAGDG